MQKAVLRLTIRDERIRRKVFMTASGFSGVKSVEIDDKNEKMTVIGHIDAPAIVMKLRKICNNTMIDSVEPVVKPETKPDPPKPDTVPVSVIPLHYYPSYADCYYPSYAVNAQVVEEEPKIWYYVKS